MSLVVIHECGPAGAMRDMDFGGGGIGQANRGDVVDQLHQLGPPHPRLHVQDSDDHHDGDVQRRKEQRHRQHPGREAIAAEPIATSTRPGQPHRDLDAGHSGDR